MSATPSTPQSAVDLLSYEPFIRAIARSLVKNEDRVGDVVQETWLRALTKPPREAGSLKSWLGRVTRNVALHQYRGDSNRTAREKVAAKQESILDHERDLGMHGKIVEAVLALDEPYKSVVILRYYRDMSPAQIAVELNRNAATVRSQLHRAHEELKTILDRQFGGDRAAWVALCVPLAGKKAALSGGGTALKVAAAVIGLGAIAAAVRWLPSSGTAPAASSHLATLDPELAPVKSELQGNATAPPIDAGNKRTALTSRDSILVTSNGVPVEGVDVWSLALSDIPPEAIENEPELQLDPEKLFARFGAHALTDDEGRAALDSSGEDFAVLAVQGRFMKIMGTEETKVVPLEAKLEQVAAVTVRVVDSSGKAVVGVPVVLHVTLNDPIRNQDTGPDRMDMMTHRTERESGLALFRGFDTFVTGDAEQQWSVQLEVPGVDSRQQEFALDRDSEEPITLELQNTGELIVRCFDEHGELLAFQGEVLVQDTSHDRTAVFTPLNEGSANFPFVGVRSQLEVSVIIPDLGATWKQDCTGPRSAGATATVDIRQLSSPTLRGRLLDDEGEPLPNTAVRLSLFNEEYRQLQATELKTDSSGMFSAEVDRKHVGRAANLNLVRYSPDGRTLCAEREQAIVLADTLTEVGDVQLREYRRGIRGRCVTAAGQPLAGINISAEQIAGFGSGGDTTAADGSFSLPGIYPELPLLEVSRATRWVLPAPVTVHPDQDEVELVLVPGGTIAGAILVDEGVDPGRVIVTATNESSTDVTGTRWDFFGYCDGETGQTGQFEARGLRSGTYLLRFLLDGGTLLEIPGVAVTVSEPSTDPRIELVDLRGQLMTLQFRVVDHEGRPFGANRALATVVSDGKQVGYGINGEDGRIELASVSAPDALIYVSATDTRGAIVDPEDCPEDVVLELGIPVTLRTLQRLDRKRGEHTYYLSLHRIEDDPRLAGIDRNVSLPSSLMTDGSASVRFPAPGRYQLYYSQHSSTSGSGAMSASSPQPVAGNADGFWVEVPESSASVTLDIELPAELPR